MRKLKPQRVGRLSNGYSLYRVYIRGRWCYAAALEKPEYDDCAWWDEGSALVQGWLMWVVRDDQP